MLPTKAVLASDQFDRRYPYPRRVYNIFGAPWQSSRNSKRNFAVISAIWASTMYFFVFIPGTKYEVHHRAPEYPTWYMRWNRQYKDDPYGEKMFAGKTRYVPLKDDHH